jgi:hypothetical protein
VDWTLSIRRASRSISGVAAENFYGELARQIGGQEVAVTAVTSIMSNSDQKLGIAAPTARC